MKSMKKTFRFFTAFVLLAICCCCAVAGNLEVRVYNIVSQQVKNRKVTLTLLDPGPVTAGNWVLAGDSYTLTTGTNGIVTFTNVLEGSYRLDVLGTPGRSYPFGMPSTNGTVLFPEMLGSTNATPVFYTANQVDALIVERSGAGVFTSAGTNTTAETNGNVVTINADVSHQEVTDAASAAATAATNALISATNTWTGSNYWSGATVFGATTLGVPNFGQSDSANLELVIYDPITKYLARLSTGDAVSLDLGDVSVTTTGQVTGNHSGNGGGLTGLTNYNSRYYATLNPVSATNFFISLGRNGTNSYTIMLTNSGNFIFTNFPAAPAEGMAKFQVLASGGARSLFVSTNYGAPLYTNSWTQVGAYWSNNLASGVNGYFGVQSNALGVSWVYSYPGMVSGSSGGSGASNSVSAGALMSVTTNGLDYQVSITNPFLAALGNYNYLYNSSSQLVIELDAETLTHYDGVARLSWGVSQLIGNWTSDGTFGATSLSGAGTNLTGLETAGSTSSNSIAAVIESNSEPTTNLVTRYFGTLNYYQSTNVDVDIGQTGTNVWLLYATNPITNIRFTNAPASTFYGFANIKIIALTNTAILVSTNRGTQFPTNLTWSLNGQWRSNNIGLGATMRIGVDSIGAVNNTNANWSATSN